METLSIALSNLKKNMSRTGFLFVIIAIVSCTLFASALFLKSINNALRIGTYRLGADILVVPADAEKEAREALLSGKPTQFFMDRALLEQVKHVEGVARATPQLFIRRQSNASCCYDMDVFLVAFDPDTDFTVKPWIDKNLGRKLANNEVITGTAVPVAAGEAIPFYGTAFTVRGAMEATGMDFFDRSVVMNLEAAYKMAEASMTKAVQPLSIGGNRISTILVRTAGDISPERVAIRIEHDVPGVKALVSDAVISTARKQLTVLMYALVIMSNVHWIVILLILAFAFHTIAKERNNDAALRHASGESRRRLAAVIMHEAAVLAAAGGTAGLLAGFLLLVSFKGLMLHYLKLPYLFPSTPELTALTVGALVFSILTGLLASAVPAVGIVRSDPGE